MIITGFLGTRAVAEDGSKALKYNGNNGKGGRPRMGQQAQVKASGKLGGQVAVL